MANKNIVSKSYPHNVKSFTEHLKKCLKYISEPLQVLFETFKKGDIGGIPRNNALGLFDEWAHRSLLPKPNETCEFVKSVFSDKMGTEVVGSVEKIYKELEEKLPFESKAIGDFVDKAIASIRMGKNISDAIYENVWILYDSAVKNFLYQTAHIIVGRILLYRVGVDKGVFEPVSSSTFDKPHLELYHTIRKNYENLIPEVYALSEFDWWYIPDIHKGALSNSEKVLLDNIESDIDKALEGIFNILNAYDFSYVDRDVWKEVYLEYLSEDERRRLGFVPTPDEIVELILDLIGYEEDSAGLCEKKLLDPACGSGTFLVEAVRRLRAHLERPMPCHSELHDKRKPEWERKKEILDKITKSIYGVDIHPFATFLTTLNIIFQLLDLYMDVKRYHPYYNISLEIVTHDALMKGVEEAQTRLDEHFNARFKEALRRKEKYLQVIETKFDYVVGNPPWGGVLRGKLGPLSDSRKREEYRKRYSSATGKFDIYVLFMERGLEWLKEGGTLGMITQITYLDSEFGRGIREYILNNATVMYLIDLSEFGDIIFPGFTNYPAITIMRKSKSSDGKVIRIKVSKGD